MPTLGFGSLLLIAFVALLIFGPKKLPDLGKAVGNSLREFKNATKGLADDEEDDVKKIEKKDEVK
ncbi:MULTISPECIES: twin-arginine translocase TatA/TatE family subunit [Metabacillus]|jgi:sec-independent protein translocase protein TatA|uniref:Sec-independent protein translocase protein TatA n=4 Tax=Metabacillus TaxID=2675233 RepID=A0A179SWL6_9BACI|nr:MULTISPECIES: twin-arginine translocase TatA/TatE family subunit [Metabacillus]MBO1515164.1 twin-arginine translocase TatA/TatE family subunit [Metabacillus bambusae]OAS84683.1 preprotein translocase subunit TatA [Metabacillus litoralis]QNF27917.1 twin-arginine translocase TatA/TatE family subunit [Metabacillus sp. KUDC1714]